MSTDEGWMSAHAGTLRDCAHYGRDFCAMTEIRTAAGWVSLEEWVKGDGLDQNGWIYQESTGGDGRIVSPWYGSADRQYRSSFPLRTAAEAYSAARGSSITPADTATASDSRA